MPGEGLEPTRPCGQRILSPLRLPISPTGHVSAVFILWCAALQVAWDLALRRTPVATGGAALVPSAGHRYGRDGTGPSS